jgi:hypothetical protein
MEIEIISNNGGGNGKNNGRGGTGSGMEEIERIQEVINES